MSKETFDPVPYLKASSPPFPSEDVDLVFLQIAESLPEGGSALFPPEDLGSRGQIIFKWMMTMQSIADQVYAGPSAEIDIVMVAWCVNGDKENTYIAPAGSYPLFQMWKEEALPGRTFIAADAVLMLNDMRLVRIDYDIVAP